MYGGLGGVWGVLRRGEMEWVAVGRGALGWGGSEDTHGLVGHCVGGYGTVSLGLA